MSEEQKEALEILKGLEFEEYDWYVKTDKIEGHANDVVEKVEKALQTILNLFEKQQKEIEKRLEEIDSLYKMMSAKDDEIEELKHFKKEVIDIIKYADDTAEPTYWNIRKLLGLGE